MLTQAHITQASKGLPAPEGLTSEERTQYILLYAIYLGYRNREHDKETGGKLKGFVLDYARLPHKERHMLVQYCFFLLCGGDMQSVNYSRELSHTLEELKTGVSD